MPQLTFFGSSETVLADDERGRMIDTPLFIDGATAHAWW